MSDDEEDNKKTLPGQEKEVSKKAKGWSMEDLQQSAAEFGFDFHVGDDDTRTENTADEKKKSPGAQHVVGVGSQEDAAEKKKMSSIAESGQHGGSQEDAVKKKMASMASIGKPTHVPTPEEDDIAEKKKMAGMEVKSLPFTKEEMTNSKKRLDPLSSADRAGGFFPTQNSVGAFPMGGSSTALQEPEETIPTFHEIATMEDVADTTSPEDTNLVVAELATDQDVEMLREKEEENETLRAELRRLHSTMVAAQLVEAIRASATIAGNTLRGSVRGSVRAGPQQPQQEQRRKRCMWICIVIAVLLIVVVVAVPVAVLTKDNENTKGTSQTAPSLASTLAPTPIPTATDYSVLPVLDTIHEKGVVRCRAETFEVNQGYGFTIDLCRALAAAVLGDADKVVFLKIPFGDQFRAITMGEVDISTTLNTVNMERDVYHQETNVGYTFSDPYYYSAMTFAGLPDFVDCVDRGDSFDGICRQLVVCVIGNSVTEDLVTELLPGAATFEVDNGVDLMQKFANGTCNVIAGNRLEIYEQGVRDQNFTGEYVFSSRGAWSFEPLAMLTRQSDPQWSDFSNWVFRSLVAAEYLNITQQNADTFPQTQLFGEENQDMFIRAIAAVGNYGEMYERHFEERNPRQGMNMLNTGTQSGLLVTDPLGKILIDESLHRGPLPGPWPNGTLEAIKKRGHLLCGLSEQRLGFATFDFSSGLWSGIDVEFCKAVSASIFEGEVDTVVYENFDGTWSDKFAALGDGSADILSGANVMMRTDIKEPMTDHGYSISPPYFFNQAGDRRALVTRQDDAQWSDLVRSVYQATLYAESHGITQLTASKMPVVELFGPDNRQMLRDTIRATGNYAEIYNRTIGMYIPRYGWNQLNTGNDPQHFPHSFGE